MSGPTVGILGGGQLGRMLAMAAARLGVRCRCYDPAPDACSAHVTELVVGDFSDQERLDRFAAGVDVVTYEFENVPVETAAERLARRVPVYPPPGALRVCQDRLEEKKLFTSLGIGTAAFAPVDSRAELDAAVDRLGLPAVLKTRRMGYDGKGQMVLRQPADVERAWTLLGQGKSPLILEAFVPFSRELSIIAAASPKHPSVFYPLTENQHEDGILRSSRSPAPRSEKLENTAIQIASGLLNAMSYVGVLAVELFEVEGRLLANEMAPRVHNSGHWTIDGSPASQFENHIRAILGLTLGLGAPADAAGMYNLIGDCPPTDVLCAIPGARVHLYEKAPRKGRKIGHVNFVGTRAQVEHGLTSCATRCRPASEAAQA